jgi:hypothetical protein
MKPLMYVPGQNADADRLAREYEKMEQNGLLTNRTADAERDPDRDPLGMNAPPTNDRGVAREVVERMVKFFQLCIGDFKLSPSAAVYAAELVSLNILNAQDIPLKPEEIEAARKEAYEYYEQIIRKL